GKLPNDLGAKMIVRQHPDSVRRNDWPKPVDGLLNQRPVAEKAQDLLRGFTPAARPEARASPAGEDQSVRGTHASPRLAASLGFFTGSDIHAPVSACATSGF